MAKMCSKYVRIHREKTDIGLSMSGTLGRLRLSGVLFAVLFFFALIAPAAAEEEYYMKHPKNFTVEEAYAFFDRPRTPYDKSISPLPENEAAYLEHLFYTSDMATQARVNMMQYYFAGTQAHKKYLPDYLKIMEEIIESFTLTRAPTEELKKIEELYLIALGEQRDFFIKWSSMRGSMFLRMRSQYKKDEFVESSHKKLQRIYMQLMLLYPSEDIKNQEAFYNHIAALDFI